ncbi:MAG TPA: hypothetical protein VFY68_05395 [Nitrososphaeraceae archaeon]|nr:hypothetical protein [Nitrososphaeraceae archaeon]
MAGQYAAVFIVIIMALVSTIIVIAQSQNETGYWRESKHKRQNIML